MLPRKPPSQSVPWLRAESRALRGFSGIGLRLRKPFFYLFFLGKKKKKATARKDLSGYRELQLIYLYVYLYDVTL
jgi:hypothetical protein